MPQTDINWLNLLVGSLILIIPISIFIYYKVGIAKELLIAFARMAIQLSLVGIYLQYIFELDNIWINLSWLIIMIVVAGFTISARTIIKYKFLTTPLIIALTINVLLIGATFWLLIVGESMLYAQYMIPIMGMVIGSNVNSTVVGLRSFFNSVSSNTLQFYYNLSTGAGYGEAISPFISKALKDAFSPTVASTATIGLIWLPGMMTGQILGGSDPIVAIKYQIMIVIAIFVGSVITVFTTLYLSKYFVFDNWKRFRTDTLRN